MDNYGSMQMFYKFSVDYKVKVKGKNSAMKRDSWEHVR
jgi:hypothetical protein